MSNYNSEIDISSSLMLTEELKAELLSSVSKLYTSMTHGDITTSARSEIFADILIDTYLLAEMLGVSNNALDTKLLSRIRLMLLDNNCSDNVKRTLLQLSKHIDKNRDIR